MATSRRSARSATAVTRRAFLGGVAAAGLAACSGGSQESSPSSTTEPLPATPRLSGDPFTLGVASGDPLPDGVTLWTRLAPDPLDAASMPETDVPVAWEVAADEDFDDVVQSGTLVTGPALAHSVHVDVRDLEPAQPYWYRFTVGQYDSPVGRTLTAPAADSSPERLRFAIANCQAYQSGYYTPYPHLADEDVEFVVFLGDYIYELEASIAARPHGLPPPQDLDQFRTLYGRNKTDTDLQAAHAAHPWIVTWDDHEVEDNYADLVPGAVGQAANPNAKAEFPDKRAAAYRAFWEHMPIRAEPPSGPDLQIYRAFRFGDLVSMPVLDARQYRTPPPADAGAAALPRSAGGGAQLPESFDEDRTLLGKEQEAWLEEKLRSSDARWNVLAQQSIMAECDRAPDDPNAGFSIDSWDGFVAARNRLLGFIDDQEIDNVVSVGGDIHTSAVTDLHTDFQEPGSPIVAAELIGPSVSALENLPDGYPQGALSSPHIHLYDIERHGYLRCEVDQDAFRADYRWVATTLEPESGIETGSSWVVESGRPGAQEV